VYSAAVRWKARSGYAAIQSSRPQTLAYAPTDSPLRLLAWNLEWFVDYDPAQTEQVAIDADAILTDVTICWHTNNGPNMTAVATSRPCRPPTSSSRTFAPSLPSWGNSRRC
jgi:hypothetical protein